MTFFWKDSLGFIKQGACRVSASQMGVVVRDCIHPLQKQIRDPEKSSARDHVAVLADMMKRDEWLPGDKLDFAELNGRLFLLNGTHRAHAQLQSGKTIDWYINIHRVEDEAQFKALFYKFDTNVRPRTDHQIVVAAGFAAEHKLSRAVASALYKAVTIIRQGFVIQKSNRDNVFSRVADRRLDAAAAWAKEALLYGECLEGAEGKLRLKLLNAGPTAVALVTLRYQKDKAIEFWSGVAGNDGLRRYDPRHTLVQDLQERNMNSGNAHQSCAAPALAWNSWFRGESRKIIKINDNPRILIDGTPFDGSRR